MKKRINVNTVNVAVFLLVIFLLGIFNLLVYPKPTISVYENRALRPRPHFSVSALLSGRFFRDYEEYFADTFIGREAMMQANSQLRNWRGFNSDVAIIAHAGNNTAGKNDEGEGQPQVDERLFVVGNKAAFIHRFCPESAAYYAKTLNAVADKFPAGVQAYSLIAPTQIAFWPEEKYQSLSAPEDATIAYINKQLSSRVQPIPAYQSLQKHASDYLFFRTDFHWTATGAYYAYVAFMEARGESPLALSQYEVTHVPGFLGSMHSATLSQQMESNPDTVHIYHPNYAYKYFVLVRDKMQPALLLNMTYASQKNKYGIFLGGDRPLAKITTDTGNQKSLLVIKDSYGNAFVPFLIPHYTRIYVVDPRHYDGDVLQLIDENDIQEVLFLNNIQVTESRDFANIIKSVVR